MRGSTSTPTTSQPRCENRRPAIPVPQPTSRTCRGPSAMRSPISASGYVGRDRSYCSAFSPKDSARRRFSWSTAPFSRRRRNLAAVDVLVVVGDGQPPERLSARATHVVRTPTADLAPDVVADLRPRTPRHVGVVGPVDLANETATNLHHAGLPVTIYADVHVDAHDGVDVEPLTDPGPKMEVAGSLLDLVGNTPLVRLDRIGRALSCHLLGKLEFLNPGGSVKDRPAVAMVDAAERAGLIGPRGTIVEPTSGNTGVGLAIVAARRRYRCVFVMPDKMSQEKIALLRAYGAEVV